MKPDEIYKRLAEKHGMHVKTVKAVIESQFAFFKHHSVDLNEDEVYFTYLGKFKYNPLALDKPIIKEIQKNAKEARKQKERCYYL